MESAYSLWNCSDSEQCTGMCVASGEISKDVISKGSTSTLPLVSTLRSHLAHVALFNPATDTEVVISNLTLRIIMDFNIIGELNLTLYGLQVGIFSILISENE